MPIHIFDQLESTNKYCELLDLSQTEEFYVVAARSQTAGVGQGANHWESEPGKNLTFSIVLRPTFLPVADQFMITKAISLGITDWLHKQAALQSRIRIKWPNDIYVTQCGSPLATNECTDTTPSVSCSTFGNIENRKISTENRKICGVLTSNHVTGNLLSSSVVGVGLNVNQERFSSWIPNPVSLHQLTGQPYLLDVCLHALLPHIQKRYRQLQAHHWEQIDNDYRSLLLRRNEECPYIYKGVFLRATLMDVNRFGHLILIDKEGSPLTADLKELKFVF